MRTEKLISVLIVLIYICLSSSIYTQSPPTERKVYNLKENKSAPFKESKTKITEIKFYGLDIDYEKYDLLSENPLPESKARKALNQNRVLNKPNQVFNAKEIEKAIKTLNKWLVSKGYLKADIVVTGKLLPKDEMELIFTIERNTPVEITDIQFVGNKHISTEAFVTNYKNCIGERWRIFDRNLYQYIVETCSKELLFSNGFFQGKIGQVTPKFINDNYLLKIEVEEGVRFRVGEINIENPKATAFSNKEILEMLGINSGDIIDGKKFRDFIFEDLKNKYADKGYIEYDGVLDPKFIQPLAEGLDGTVNLKIIIDEGAQFTVGQIRFDGIEEEAQKRLKNIFSIKENQIYSQSKFKEALKEINALREFLPIGIDEGISIVGSDRRSWAETSVSRSEPHIYIVITTSKLTDEERKDVYDNQELLKGYNRNIP